MLLLQLPTYLGGDHRNDPPGHVRDDLSAYLDNGLSAAERARVRDHLRLCPDCENELATLTATKQLLGETPAVALPRSFVLTPEMVGRGVVRPPVVVRRRALWTLAGRLRLATAGVAVILALVVSADALHLSGTAMMMAPEVHGLLPVTALPAATAAPAAILGQAQITPGAPERLAVGSAAEATATSAVLAPSTLPSAPGGPPAPAAAAPQSTPPPASSTIASVPSVGTGGDASQFDRLIAGTPAGAGAGTNAPNGPSQPNAYEAAPYSDNAVQATLPPTVDPWRLVEGALALLVGLLAVSTFWAARRGV